MKIYLLVYKADNFPVDIQAFSNLGAAVQGFYAKLGEMVYEMAQNEKDDVIAYIKEMKWPTVADDNLPYYYTYEDELYIEEVEVDEYLNFKLEPR